MIAIHTSTVLTESLKRDLAAFATFRVGVDVWYNSAGTMNEQCGYLP
jgi:hypothetical protein